MTSQIRLTAIATSIILLQACGGGSDQESGHEGPATVENAVEETQLAAVTLSTQAESRLGIVTMAVERQDVRRTRVLGGEVMVVPGSSVTVTAPVSGTVMAPPEAAIPRAGGSVRRGGPICRLLPTLPAMDLVGAREQLRLKQVQLDVARSAAERAERRLEDGSGSVRINEEAQAELARAELAYQVISSQLEILEGSTFQE